RKTGKIIRRLGTLPCVVKMLRRLYLTATCSSRQRAAPFGPSYPFSRVIEVEPATKKIVWEYRENRESDFFSPRISNAQRLPNGNTLICEGDFGRLFEVTVGGEIVWEYVNPYFGGPPTAQNNRIFRAYRYSAEDIARARATGTTP